MPTIIGFDDDIAITGESIDVSDVTLSSTVFSRWNITVIENDHWITRRRFLLPRNSHQGINFKSIGFIRDDISVVIRAGVKCLLEYKIAALISSRPQVINAQWNTCHFGINGDRHG